MEKRVTGIGGIFFKAKSDNKKLQEWYSKHLGLKNDPVNGILFQWSSPNDPTKKGETVFSIFDKETTYINPGKNEFMINFRVKDLEKLLIVLKEEGVELAGEMEVYDYGKFAWIMDPDGNKIELWEAPESSGFSGAMDME
ncbi:MAG: VOC family protein [Chitinophagales bacterium]|nr:VOC family protein [Bacteroidota bacterium]MBK8488917.1 VOC family protein [Bacteroidota bacterium]MBK8680767.1 VOC family protein [Bacteroidota bacterium]MBP7400603.1 VOC family protein [Chitinophagales bacterium]MBP9549804.1 VOC family protein [Chitinophagales bacterium]